MKKIIVILLVAVLLCGCSAGKQIGGNTPSKNNPQNTDIKEIVESPALAEVGEGKREESYMVLRFTINPDFELYLDEMTEVSKVRCLNEDAKTLFANMDVLGLAYTEAVEAILTAAKDQSFITEETDRIQIQTAIIYGISVTADELEDLASDLAQPVEAFQQTHELTFTVVSETPVLENSVEEDAGEDVASGNVHGAPNAVVVEKYYREDGQLRNTKTFYYDENGVFYKEVFESSEAVVTNVYDKNRVMTESTQENADGTKSHAIYGPDGKPTSREFICSEYTETSTYTDGVISSYTQVYADGQTTTYTYHPNGKLATGHTKDPVDDYVKDEVYDENGCIISCVQLYGDGTKYENTYYPGTEWAIQLECSTDPVMGTYFETHFAEDGTITKRTGSDNRGNTYEETFHANGKTATYISIGPESSSEARYDENGNKIYSFFKDAYSEYVIENDAFTYYMYEGELVTDEKELQSILDAMRLAGGW